MPLPIFTSTVQPAVSHPVFLRPQRIYFSFFPRLYIEAASCLLPKSTARLKALQVAEQKACETGERRINHAADGACAFRATASAVRTAGVCLGQLLFRSHKDETAQFRPESMFSFLPLSNPINHAVVSPKLNAFSGHSQWCVRAPDCIGRKRGVRVIQTAGPASRGFVPLFRVGERPARP